MPIKISKEAWRRAVSVILRVPSLFIAEAWYRTSPTAMQQQYLGKGVSPDRSQEILIQVVYYSGEYKAHSRSTSVKNMIRMKNVRPVTFVLKPRRADRMQT